MGIINSKQKSESEKEIWKPVVGYEGLYEVSNLGRIKSLPKYHYKDSKILNPTLNKKQKRYSVLLCKNSKHRKRINIHRLVALAFVPNPKPNIYTEVNHKDENPKNNRADNLEWCDRWYNMHYNDLPSRIPIPDNAKCIIGTDEDGNVISFNSLTEANQNGFCSRVLSTIINNPNTRKKGNYYKGYFWEIKDGKNK